VRFAAAIAVALTFAGTAAAAPPNTGVLVPGRSLGGIELGATKAEVERRWGRAYGVCRNCAAETWYFNYFAFQPRGAGVEWRNGRVAAVFTLYQPAGWRTTRGLELGDPESRIVAIYTELTRHECAGYLAYRLAGLGTTTAFYAVDGRVWAFALLRPGMPLCR
jgi:hypothetical protein